MPWRIEQREGQFCVIKETDGSTEKCHSTREMAERHMRALYASEPETRAAPSLDGSAWDANRAMTACKTAADYNQICAGKKAGDPALRSSHALPHHYLGRPANAAGVRAARQRFAQTEGLTNAAEARRHIFETHRLPSDEQRSSNAADVEIRSSSITSVDTRQRIIDLVAVPWNQEADVFWRGEMWREVVLRGAFDGIETHAGRIRVNRQHVVGDTIGKVVQFENATDGLRAQVKIAETPRGDDTLALAEEDMIGASVGYRIQKPSDVQVNNRTKMRRVMRAFIDHLSMVEDPAFEGARVLAVRAEPSGLQVAEPLPPTPALDEAMNDDVFAWARARLSR